MNKASAKASKRSLGWKARACFLVVLAGLAGSTATAQESHEYAHDTVRALGKAQVAADTGSLNEAKAQYEHIIKTDPECPEAYVGLGHVCLLMGRYAEAEKPLNAALKLQPANPNVYNGLGNAAYRQGHYAQSIANFEDALKYATDDTYKIHANLANALSDSGHVDEAVKHFAQAIDLKPDYAPAYNGLATMYYNKKHYDLAVENARKAISYKPDYAMGYYNLGIALIQQNKISEAKAALNDSLKYEKNASYQQDTKRILAKIEMTPAPGPQTAQTQSLTSTPENTLAGQEIERMLKEKQWQNAETAIDTQIRAGGERNPINWNNLGYAQMHEDGKLKQARASFEKAISLSGGHNSTAHYNLGQVLRSLGDNKGAEANLRRSIADSKLTRTPCALAQTVLGIMLKQRNDLVGAEACYRKALMDADGNLPVIHYNRAIVLERMNHSREAVNEYKAYLTRSPNGLNAKEAQQRLKMLGVDPG